MRLGLKHAQNWHQLCYQLSSMQYQICNSNLCVESNESDDLEEMLERKGKLATAGSRTQDNLRPNTSSYIKLKQEHSTGLISGSS